MLYVPEVEVVVMPAIIFDWATYIVTNLHFLDSEGGMKGYDNVDAYLDAREKQVLHQRILTHF